MDAVSLIISGLSGGVLLTLAGVVYAAGKHVRSLETIEEARKAEVGHLAKIPTLETRMAMVESSCATAVNETRATREQVIEMRAEMRADRREVGGVSALRPMRGPRDP